MMTNAILGTAHSYLKATNEPVWIIRLSGKLADSDFPKWRLYDNEGRVYQVKIDYTSSSIMENKDGAELDQTLIVKGLPSLPEELTLSLLTIKKQFTDINWKVAIPSKQ
ncbi:hypothetical protein NDK47_01990 [Brevibacillus ruminantium]|uniref:Uncharacterized protein n=1 Tax=Brevibacillus ruminantium TaxID=2950604 RepID=A0ABY4WNA8_9BACL|nr:hypothetical protein [Brevibacillus ruminantium]USG66131.1 hypothetical protein NDK47_01990 [Brevibacillus ruminantium]